MASINNGDVIEFYPGYDPYLCLASQRYIRQTNSCFWTNLNAIVLSVALCAAGLYYYEVAGREIIQQLKNPYLGTEKDCVIPQHLTDIKKELNILKSKLEKTEKWRRYLDDLYSKIYLQQDFTIDQKIKEALDVYDSDKIGLYDYAAVYASGSIVSTPSTRPYPVNKTINMFNLVKINVLSNPENLLQPNNLPGNCFAFHGTEGRIRIKLGKRIIIKAVTVDHIKIYGDRISAPKDFKVYGVDNPHAEPDILLGQFTYNIKGWTHQTFKLSGSNARSFEYVELHILNNHGREEFTCIYRFRVHDNFIDQN